MTQKYIVRLSTDERKMLFQLLEERSISKEKQNRARILLKADCGEEGENWKGFKKNELKPWQKREWCIAPARNTEFVCQMEEVLDIYKRPYDSKYPVICMDESSKQLIKEVRQPLPMKPGDVEKLDTEYERNGTASIFMAFKPLQGLRFTKITEQRTRTDWAYYIREIVDNNYYQGAEKIIFVMDNLNALMH